VTKRGSIDRDAVLDAALRVARRVGLDGLSMRMVAEELGVSAMAAYRHVPNREALVSLAADQLASTIQVPTTGTWQERLLQLQREAFRAGIEVPGQVDTTVLTWGPNHRRLLDSMLTILTDAGFDDDDVTVAFELMWAYMIGQIRIHEHLVTRRDAVTPEGPTSSYPILAAVIDRVPSIPPEEYFERGFAILLEGLEARLARTTGRGTSAR
jgi:TetR/AcrR family transcriptional regulator, tetracycline repressor protein